MLEAAHSLTGAVIAYKIGNPALALPFAFISHFITDQFPHWNPDIGYEKKKFGMITKKTNFYITIDCLVGLFFGLFVAFKVLPDIQHFYLIIAGSFFAILPDLLEAPYYYFNANHSPLIKILTKYQGSHQWNVSFWLGMFIQALYVLLLFRLL